MTSLRFLTFTFENSYILKLLRLETLMFSDVTLSDINVVWCYVLSQYRLIRYGWECSRTSTTIYTSQSTVHCKDKMPKFRNKYSQKRNIGVSVPISTFMRLWVIYIFPQSVWLFCWRKYVSWEYINRSQTRECGNCGWGRANPRKGIYKRNCRCSVG